MVTNINKSKNISQVRFSDKGFQVKFPNKTSYKKELFDFHRSLDFRITNAGLQVYNKIERSEVRSIVYWFLEIHLALEAASPRVANNEHGLGDNTNILLFNEEH